MADIITQKTMPHSAEAESSVIGSMLIDREAIGQAAQKLWESEQTDISDIIDFGGDFAFRSVRV